MCGIWGIFGSDVDCHEQVQCCFKIAHRGPDCFRFENVNHFQNCAFGFHRLAIVDDLNGMQPIRLVSMPHIWMIYNGEIYNYKQLQAKYNFDYLTNCDGESLIHLYNKGGIDFMCKNLYGVFAFILLDTKENKLYCGRDSYGVRPAFKLLTENGTLGICSEAKGLLNLKLVQGAKFKIEFVEPGTFEEYSLHLAANNDRKVRYERKFKFHEITQLPAYDVSVKLMDNVLENIRNALTNSVKMRLMSQRRMGCLLSGGLDSSLITGLMVHEARKAGINYPIQTFSIGMSHESPDILAARRVAKQLNTEHHEIIFTAQDAIESIRDVIKALESFDVTTIRASIGMYLISKYIKENTDTVVIFSGEGSDEVCQGYIYFYKAPNENAAHDESLRICNDLYLFDVCRADRTTAAHGLELRVPFLDHFFSSYYLSISRKDKIPTKDRCEKYLLRKAFDGLDIIPSDILWRPKEAFSDGVASKKKSLFEHLQEHINPLVKDEDLIGAPRKYPLNTPLTKEAYFYREIFAELFPDCDHFTPYMWLPRWCGNVIDPSARTLNHYDSRHDSKQVEA
ncbi:asparagine synthetase [glutamine-hydrolyzing] [Brachionus plicatilis]|uniref:Asparagine synthetase [glutamine-hydrolyzing] n=1 Tax=Brachionus plicatilis TaxID=10195 RepID=A0A3M7PE85_BRAPC|nr:asparagine synthetase [glutamine-hydrolyzing] [Brachionus plicatilis]